MERATTADANYCHPTIRWAGYSYNNQVPIKRGAPLHCAQIVTERSQFQSIYVTFSHICAGSGAYVGRVPQGERPPSFLRYSSPGFVSGKGKRHLRPAPAYCAWDRYSHHRVISARLVVPQRPRRPSGQFTPGDSHNLTTDANDWSSKTATSWIWTGWVRITLTRP